MTAGGLRTLLCGLGHAALRILCIWLALATLAALLGDAWWIFDLATHFRIQYLVLGLCLVALSLIARRLALAVLAALCVSVHVAAVWDASAIGRAEAAPRGPALRIVTLNLDKLSDDHAATLAFLGSSDADLLVLQEVENGWDGALAPLRSAFPHAAPAGLPNRAGMVILSRLPILSSEMIFPVSEWFPAGIVRVEIAGKRIVVANVHPPHPKGAYETDARGLYLERVAEAASRFGEPLILAGDFNMSPWSGQFRRLLVRFDLVDAGGGEPWLVSWPTWLPWLGIPIDHVLASSQLAVTGIRRGPDVGSDHYPLIVDLVLKD